MTPERWEQVRELLHDATAAEGREPSGLSGQSLLR